jgi:TatD DNase family protein
VTLRAMASVLTIDVPTLCRAVSDNSERVYGPWHAERIGQTA